MNIKGLKESEAFVVGYQTALLRNHFHKYLGGNDCSLILKSKRAKLLQRSKDCMEAGPQHVQTVKYYKLLEIILRGHDNI
jgi:hypothetical protein